MVYTIYTIQSSNFIIWTFLFYFLFNYRHFIIRHYNIAVDVNQKWAFGCFLFCNLQSNVMWVSERGPWVKPDWSTQEIEWIYK